MTRRQEPHNACSAPVGKDIGPIGKDNVPSGKGRGSLVHSLFGAPHPADSVGTSGRLEVTWACNNRHLLLLDTSLLSNQPKWLNHVEYLPCLSHGSSPDWKRVIIIIIIIIIIVIIYIAPTLGRGPQVSLLCQSWIANRNAVGCALQQPQAANRIYSDPFLSLCRFLLRRSRSPSLPLPQKGFVCLHLCMCVCVCVCHDQGPVQIWLCVFM